ncbi:hypothetical protein C0991_004215 [Blastosporella zonata]|nr:hypothetical protein C0991_004215 [Blastosporella zonata]
MYHDPRIFQRYVHKFPCGELRRSIHIHNPPAAPSLPRFLKKMPSIVAPKPQRPLPLGVYKHHAGLSSDYEVESYATPKPTDAPLPAFTPPLPVLRTMMHQPREHYDEPFEFQPEYAIPSFYPQHVQSAIKAAVTPEPAPDRIDANTMQPNGSSSTQRQLRLHQPPPSEPPPLGSWPREIHTLPPARASRKKPLPNPAEQGPILPKSAPAAPPPLTAAVTLPPQAAVAVSRNTSFPPRARPSGPRRRSDGEGRVVVPELSSGRNASSYQPGR